jgi:hypothetical protein
MPSAYYSWGLTVLARRHDLVGIQPDEATREIQATVARLGLVKKDIGADRIAIRKVNSVVLV